MAIHPIEFRIHLQVADLLVKGEPGHRQFTADLDDARRGQEDVPVVLDHKIHWEGGVEMLVGTVGRV